MTEDGKITFAGVSLDHVPTWVMAVAGLAAAGAIALGAYTYVWRQPEKSLVTLQEANAAILGELNEYERHLAEDPESQAVLLDDARGQLKVLRYADGCVLLSRTATGIHRAKLVIDLARDKDVPPTKFTLDDLTNLLAEPVAAAGQCLAVHPGPFNWWYGAKNGCFVEVWKHYPDGCQSVQYFDACHGTFDMNVRWTSCVH